LFVTCFSAYLCSISFYASARVAVSHQVHQLPQQRQIINTNLGATSITVSVSSVPTSLIVPGQPCCKCPRHAAMQLTVDTKTAEPQTLDLEHETGIIPFLTR